HGLVHMEEAGEPRRVLALRERVVVVHVAVGEAGLARAGPPPAPRHLRQQELRPGLQLHHTDRHVLDRIVLAVDPELEPAVASRPELDVVAEPGPGVVAGAEEELTRGSGAVAEAIDPGRGPGER